MGINDIALTQQHRTISNNKQENPGTMIKNCMILFTYTLKTDKPNF